MAETKHQSFQFKQFTVFQDRCAMKVGTDGVLLGAWASGGTLPETGAPRRILDIGTGTGLIALMMAQRFPDAWIDAIEIEHEAAEQASENVAASPFADRIQVMEVSLQEYVGQVVAQADGFCRYDVIVSNPPYFVNSLKNPDVQRMTARHTDTLSFRQLMQGVSRLLADEGVFSVILPTSGQVGFESEAVISGFSKICEVQVKTKENKTAKRCMISFSRQVPTVVLREEICMMEADNQRSLWYRELTKDFYL